MNLRAVLASFTAALLVNIIFPNISSAGNGKAELRPDVTFAKDAKSTKKRSSGLAGSEGDVKQKILFGAEWVGGCESSYRRYVASGGHSAFSATIVDYFSGGGYVCGSAYNAPSQAEAERRSLAQCRQARAKYKVDQIGKCVVYSSK